jgi:hypothetical protein
MSTNAINGPADPAMQAQVSVLKLLKNTVNEQNKSALALIQSATANGAQSPAAGPLAPSGSVGTKTHIVG